MRSTITGKVSNPCVKCPTDGTELSGCPSGPATRPLPFFQTYNGLLMLPLLGLVFWMAVTRGIRSENQFVRGLCGVLYAVAMLLVVLTTLGMAKDALVREFKKS